MWNLFFRAGILFPKRTHFSQELFSQGKRFFLSDSFRCREAWEKRLETPILQNLKLGDLYNELEQKFQQDGKASAIDIDLFANAMRDESYIEEVEDLIHKLRMSANAMYVLPSTSHAFIRSMLDSEKHEDLLRILNDRLNYGVFPDDFCSCLLLDTYIKQNKYTEAAKVSVLQMLQEEWSHSLTTHLTLYACHMFLTNKCSWEEEPPAPPEDDTEEVIKVRVNYLRNPYFDDHFDLQNPKLLVGKTLAMAGSNLPDAVGRTYQLIGWFLYKKWGKVKTLLHQYLNSQEKPVIYRVGINMVGEMLQEHLKEKSDEAELDLKTEIVPLLEKLKSSDLVCDDDLQTAIENKVKHIVKLEEQQMIKQQVQLYRDWDVNRENILQEELKRLETKNRLDRVKEEKEKLVLKEQELFFFDNEDKWDLLIEKNTPVVSTTQDEVKMKKKKVTDENYVPPEI